ncbi:MAG: amidohydrolase family protein, partial [Frankia sp.]|nr:amidohydrolase family protein [Frankia sp.]
MARAEAGEGAVVRLPTLETLRLVDHHCHGLVRRELDRAGFERVLTESDQPAPAGTTFFDSQLGLAVRRWCAPVLDLPEHAPPEDYLARRAELGADEVAARMLRAAGIGEFCVDTGYLPERLTSSTELAALAGGRAYDVLRLEPVAEQVALDIVTGQVGVAHFPDLVRSRLAERAAAPVTDTAPRVVAAKSVAAYRVGLALPAGHPADREVVAAVRAWVGRLRAGAPIRLADPVLHSFLIWTAADQGLPIQIHTGFGDTDLHLAQCNPLLLTDLLRALTPTGTPVLLLHCYPFHREAGYLAQVFTHVYLDIGLTTHNLGRGSAAVLAEALELAPFGKLLFSTDAFALAELYLLGALLFRRGLDRFLGDGVADGDWTRQDAERIAQMICVGNARRVYRLAPQPAGTRAGAAATAREPAVAATSPRRRARAGQ